ncbi:MAG: transporter ATP-binding protein [Acidobacteriaceae bacterium]|nr:transporter ATP-binding protein [Acidobacteriaceae bacterium]
MSPAIVLEDLGKRYSLQSRRAANDGMRHALERAVRSPLAQLRKRAERKLRQQDFWALRHVSLEIHPGEVIGIVGRNGAGKSTMLKLLSRITVPTEGRIRINGRMGSLLEVGTGFHQELTGRENIFLNGAILGMSRAEIVRKFDEIVAFSEIEAFLDTPVKRYSSGMYVRLAFAVAAHLEPEILVIDEVLAVGDAAFQKKCLNKMDSFAQSGRTILFVSHNMEAVRSLCDRGIWMKEGRLHGDGPIDTILNEYFNDGAGEQPVFLANTDYGLTIRSVTLKNQQGDEAAYFQPGEDLMVDICYEAERRVEWPIFAVGVVGANGSCFTSNMLLDGHRPRSLEGAGRITCTFRSIPLLPQDYTVKMSIRAATVGDMILPYQDVARFTVAGDLAEYGYRGEFLRWAPTSTPVVVPYTWQLPNGETVDVSLNRTAVPTW